MTKSEDKTDIGAVKEILLSSSDGLGEVIRTMMQEVLEAEMDDTLGASKSERTPSGPAIVRVTTHTLITRVGREFLLWLKSRGFDSIELAVADDHAGLRVEETIEETLSFYRLPR